jgi:hypothetical protein
MTDVEASRSVVARLKARLFRSFTGCLEELVPMFVEKVDYLAQLGPDDWRKQCDHFGLKFVREFSSAVVVGFGKGCWVET